MKLQLLQTMLLDLVRRLISHHVRVLRPIDRLPSPQAVLGKLLAAPRRRSCEVIALSSARVFPLHFQAYRVRCKGFQVATVWHVPFMMALSLRMPPEMTPKRFFNCSAASGSSASTTILKTNSAKELKSVSYWNLPSSPSENYPKNSCTRLLMASATGRICEMSSANLASLNASINDAPHESLDNLTKASCSAKVSSCHRWRPFTK